MKYYIAKESAISPVFSDKQSFFCVIIDGLDDTVAEQLLTFKQQQKEVHQYMHALMDAANDRNKDVNLVEVPACLQDGARKEEPPKKQATAAPSSSKSQAKRKKTQSASSTSRKKAKSDG